MSSTGGGSGDPGSVNNLVPISESDNPVTPFSVSENGRRPENHSALSRHNEFLMRLHRSHLATASSHHSGKVSYFLLASSSNIRFLYNRLASMGESARLAPSSDFYMVFSAILSCKSFKI